MSVKRGVFGVLAAATMMLSMVGATSAAPNNPNANCTGVEASTNHDISFFAHLPNPTGGNGNFVSNASSTDCGQR